MLNAEGIAKVKMQKRQLVCFSIFCGFTTLVMLMFLMSGSVFTPHIITDFTSSDGRTWLYPAKRLLTGMYQYAYSYVDVIMLRFI